MLERRPDPEALGVSQAVSLSTSAIVGASPTRLLGRAHRFPTSSSRYLANLALAASCRFGSHCVGHMSSLSL